MLIRSLAELLLTHALNLTHSHCPPSSRHSLTHPLSLTESLPSGLPSLWNMYSYLKRPIKHDGNRRREALTHKADGHWLQHLQHAGSDLNMDNNPVHASCKLLTELLCTSTGVTIQDIISNAAKLAADVWLHHGRPILLHYCKTCKTTLTAT